MTLDELQALCEEHERRKGRPHQGERLHELRREVFAAVPGLIADNRRLREAAMNYLDEYDNPAKDYLLRSRLRDKLRALLASEGE